MLSRALLSGVLSQSAPNQRQWYHERLFAKRLGHDMISFNERHFTKGKLIIPISHPS